MKDPVKMQTLLSEFNNLGVNIAIDDFGTGYSSLSRLQHLPLQTLKIDKSFVSDLRPDNEGGGMISIIQQMATSFGLRTVAEGIETEQQYHYLRQAGVESGQGYWYGRPMPENEVRQQFTVK